MKKKKILELMITMLFLIFTPNGCASETILPSSNEIVLSMDGIKDLTISYDEEPITFLESGNENLIIKEYMSENKVKYHGKVKQGRHSIQVSEGGKPFFKSGFSRRIEVYLPDSYHEALTITSTDGSIDLTELPLELSSLRIDCTSGMVSAAQLSASQVSLSSASGILEIGKIEAEDIRLETTSGKILCGELDGHVTCISTSGDTEIKSASGSGSYRAENSGMLRVTYQEVNGDLTLFNKNDNINLTLPENLDFYFQAAAKNGDITASFQEKLTAEEKMLKGTIGNHPSVTVKMETKNGSIEVKQ